jgi:hypothetical protein
MKIEKAGATPMERNPVLKRMAPGLFSWPLNMRAIVIILTAFWNCFSHFGFCGPAAKGYKQRARPRAILPRSCKSILPKILCQLG